MNKGATMENIVIPKECFLNGWSVHWSFTYDKHCFYNKITNECVYDCPIPVASASKLQQTRKLSRYSETETKQSTHCVDARLKGSAVGLQNEQQEPYQISYNKEFPLQQRSDPSKTSFQAGKQTTQGGCFTTGNKNTNKECFPVGKQTTLEGASKREINSRKEETTNERKMGYCLGEEKIDKKEKEEKCQNIMPFVSKNQIDFHALKNSDDFKKCFFTGNNAKDMIDALNNYSFRSSKLKGSFVRYEKRRPYIYGIVINNCKQNHPFWKNIKKLKLKLMKVGYTRKDTTKGCRNRIQDVKDKISKGRFDTSVLFKLIIDLTTELTFMEEEQRIRSKVGLKLDSKFVRDYLRLPVSSEWVITTQKYIDSLKGRIRLKKNQGIMYTTKDVKDCDRKSIEKLVKEIDVQDVEVSLDGEEFLRRKGKLGSTTSDRMNCSTYPLSRERICNERQRNTKYHN